MGRLWIVLGCVAGLTGVGMAAAAAHALAGRLDEAGLRMLGSAVEIQGWHAPALLFTGLWAGRGGWLAHLAGAAFTLGLLLFCGAIYALALGGVHLGTTAPTGGVLLMLGWALLAASALRRR